VQRDLATLSTIHQATPHTSTQPWVVNVHHDDNHELVPLFDKVVSAKQPWQSATLCYYLARMGALTPIATFASFQNQTLTTNINLVFTNLEMEQFQLLNVLEQLHHIDQRPSN
jgi:hypothetical protein